MKCDKKSISRASKKGKTFAHADINSISRWRISNPYWRIFYSLPRFGPRFFPAFLFNQLFTSVNSFTFLLFSFNSIYICCSTFLFLEIKTLIIFFFFGQGNRLVIKIKRFLFHCRWWNVYVEFRCNVELLAVIVVKWQIPFKLYDIEYAYHMKLSEEGALERPASMSRRKQLRPFKVQDDDDNGNGDKSHGNGINGTNRANSTDGNGVETTPNGNDTDETLHSTPESGKFVVCVYVWARVRAGALASDLYLPISTWDEMKCFDFHMIFLISISFPTSNRSFLYYRFKMKMYALDSSFQEECLKFQCDIVFFLCSCCHKKAIKSKNSVGLNSKTM